MPSPFSIPIPFPLLIFAIVASRYVFVGLIGVFWVGAVVFIRRERMGLSQTLSPSASVHVQRAAILLMYICGAAILIFWAEFNAYVVFTCAAGLLFFVLGFVLTSIIYRNSCPLLWNGVFFLMAVGLLTLQRLDPALARNQLTWFCVGLAAVLLIPLAMRFYALLEKLELFYAALGLGLLLLPSILGSRIRGATA